VVRLKQQRQNLTTTLSIPNPQVTILGHHLVITPTPIRVGREYIGGLNTHDETYSIQVGKGTVAGRDSGFPWAGLAAGYEFSTCGKLYLMATLPTTITQFAGQQGPFLAALGGGFRVNASQLDFKKIQAGSAIATCSVRYDHMLPLAMNASFGWMNGTAHSLFNTTIGPYRSPEPNPPTPTQP
jgi:hypothetical protein